MDSIAALDADVITIETSRSDMKLLESFEEFEYPNEIGRACMTFTRRTYRAWRGLKRYWRKPPSVSRQSACG
jgi:hypothetical protein